MPTPRKKHIKYKDITNLNDMTLEELRVAMQKALDANKVDMLRRIVGRYNRVEGLRCMTGIMGLLSYKGQSRRDVNAVLDSHR